MKLNREALAHRTRDLAISQSFAAFALPAVTLPVTGIAPMV